VLFSLTYLTLFKIDDDDDDDEDDDIYTIIIETQLWKYPRSIKIIVLIISELKKEE